MFPSTSNSSYGYPQPINQPYSAPKVNENRNFPRAPQEKMWNQQQHPMQYRNPYYCYYPAEAVPWGYCVPMNVNVNVNADFSQIQPILPQTQNPKVLGFQNFPLSGMPKNDEYAAQKLHSPECWEPLPTRRERHQYKKTELTVLKRYFNTNNSPGTVEREKIAEELGLNVNQIKLWFKNRRAMLKKKEKEDAEQLKKTDKEKVYCEL